MSFSLWEHALPPLLTLPPHAAELPAGGGAQTFSSKYTGVEQLRARRCRRREEELMLLLISKGTYSPALIAVALVCLALLAGNAVREARCRSKGLTLLRAAENNLARLQEGTNLRRLSPAAWCPLACMLAYLHVHDFRRPSPRQTTIIIQQLYGQQCASRRASALLVRDIKSVRLHLRRCSQLVLTMTVGPQLDCHRAMQDHGRRAPAPPSPCNSSTRSGKTRSWCHTTQPRHCCASDQVCCDQLLRLRSKTDIACPRQGLLKALRSTHKAEAAAPAHDRRRTSQAGSALAHVFNSSTVALPVEDKISLIFRQFGVI